MTARKKGRRVNYMLEFATVRYWQGQLNESGIKNSASNLADTRLVYLTRLAAFNEWLPERIFDMRVQAVADGRIVRETAQKSFANVEELLRFGEDGSGNEKEIRKIISQYLRDPRHVNLAHSTMAGTCSAIKSYFDAHDVATNVKFNGKKRDEIEVTEEPELEIADFYKMMTANKVDLMVRAVMLVKFQAGLDSSTLADRFNFYAYQQIAKWCGTDDHNMWETDKCPIPVQLVRVKTGIKYTTFIDRDALDAIKAYLSWREERHGPRDPARPIFLTTRNEPIHGEWISDAFRRLSRSSRAQKRLENGVLKLRPHKTRRLLKSLLLECECAEWAADHVLGHKAKDPYTGPAELFPKRLREEYAKASHKINVLSKAASIVDGEDPAEAAEKALKESKAQVEVLAKRVNELEAEITKKDARSAGAESRFDAAVKAIIDALDDPGGDLRKNIRDRLGKL